MRCTHAKIKQGIVVGECVCFVFHHTKSRYTVRFCTTKEWSYESGCLGLLGVTVLIYRSIQTMYCFALYNDKIFCINLCCIQSFICYITLFQVSNLQISIYSNYPLLISNLQVGNFYNNYLQVVKNLTTIATVYESLSLLVFSADCCFLSLLFSGNLSFTLNFGFFGYGYRIRLRIHVNEKVVAGSK